MRQTGDGGFNVRAVPFDVTFCAECQEAVMRYRSIISFLQCNRVEIAQRMELRLFQIRIIEGINFIIPLIEIFLVCCLVLIVYRVCIAVNEV